AAAIGELFTALVITLFVLAAEVLEGMTVQRGRRAIRDLLEFLPREVSVRRAGSVCAVSADELGIGDAILVNPGGQVPVDGTVLSTIAVVIVAGACGIAAGTPLAILGGIGRAARLGAIVKGGVHLETLGRVDTVVLDKTGTLTYGRPAVQRVLAVDGVSPDAVLDAAAAAEQRSEHPLGQTIVAHARAQKRPVVEPDRFSYTPGRGIAAEVAAATVLVGNRAWMRERGVVMPDAGVAGIVGDTAASAV